MYKCRTLNLKNTVGAFWTALAILCAYSCGHNPRNNRYFESGIFESKQTSLQEDQVTHLWIFHKQFRNVPLPPIYRASNPWNNTKWNKTQLFHISNDDLRFLGEKMLLFLTGYWVKLIWVLSWDSVLFASGARVWIESVDPVVDMCLTNQVLYRLILSSNVEWLLYSKKSL